MAASFAGLVALSAALYLFFSGGSTNTVTRTDRPAGGNSPHPTPSPTPAASAGQPADAGGGPPVSPDELAARGRLAEKNIPFNEAAFARAVGEGGADSCGGWRPRRHRAQAD